MQTDANCLVCFKVGGNLNIVKTFNICNEKEELYVDVIKKCFNIEDIRNENTMPTRPGLPSLEYYRKHYNETYDPQRQTGVVTDILTLNVKNLSQGENWKDFRSKVNHILLQPKTIKLYSEELTMVAKDMVSRMRMFRDKNNVIKNEFDSEMNLWALESIGVMALGTRLNCLDPKLPEDSPSKQLIKNVRNFFDIAEKLDFGGNPWRLFPTATYRRAMKIYEEQESLTKFFVRKAINDLKESTKSVTDISDSEKPILEKLLEIDITVAEIMASDMLIAGVDTASNTVTAIFYLLAKNPDKQNKLRDEVLSNQGQKSYLRACIKESLRMMPVVGSNVRVATKEYNLMGYKVPKDHWIVFAHETMSNMKKYYLKPDSFIPERWIVEKDDPLYHGNAHPFASSPFGYGSRMCLGRRIAELEIETFVGKVVENFQIEWEGPPPNITPTSLNYITGPFNFTFKDVI